MASTYLLGEINAMQTLVENFPMSLLDYFKGREYDNVIDFILDVLAALGVDTNELLKKITEKVFKVEIPDIETLYKNIANIDISEPEWIVQTETSIQAAIAEVLVALLTCSAIPEIPDKCMDALKYVRSGAYGGKTLNKVDSFVSFYLEKITDENEIKKIGITSKIIGTYEKYKDINLENLRDEEPLKKYTSIDNYTGDTPSLDFDGNVMSDDNSKSVIKVTINEYKSDYYYVKYKFHDKYDRKTLPKKNMLYNKNKTSPATYGFMSFPIKTFDFFHKLDTSPATPYGACIYDFGDNKFTYTATRKYSFYAYVIRGKLLSEYGSCIEELMGSDFYHKLDPIVEENGTILTGYGHTWDSSTVTTDFDWKKEKEHIEDVCKNAAISFDENDLVFYEIPAGTTKSKIQTYNEALKFAGYRTDTKNKTKTNKDLYKLTTFEKCVTVECPYSTDEMYKMDDLDAVIWYAINRGKTGSTYSMNKMIWDNRLLKGKKVRNTNEQWNNWLSSKDKSYHYIYAYDDLKSEIKKEGTDAYNFYQTKVNIDGEEYDDAVLNFCYTQEGDLIAERGQNLNRRFRKRKQTLYPIMQLFRDPNFPAEQRLGVSISSQRYYNGAPANTKDKSTFLGILVPNHTLYKFNWEYMRSIKIFSAKSILAQFLDAILGGSIFAIDADFNTQFIEEQLSSALKKSIMTDDMTVQDCFYTFSNDEYNEMLNNMELRRYKAKGIYGEDTKALSIDENSIMATINSVNSSASSSGKITTIQKAVNQLTKTDGSDASVTTDGDVTMTPGMQVLYNILFALIKPFYAALFSPKVILLFLINFSISGMIDINKIHTWDDVWSVLKSKMSAILISLISIIKDKIYEIIIEIILEYIKPLIEEFIAQITLEFMERWLKQLQEYTQCIPVFNFNKYKLTSTIDAVNYADIVEPENTTPETADKC